MPVTEYDVLSKCTRDFEPYRNLWLTSDDWLKAHKVWMSDAFLDLNAEALEAQISAASKAMVKTVKAFRDQPNMLAVAEVVQKWIADFQPHVPLIQV
jgi:dynein heavy chain